MSAMKSFALFSGSLVCVSLLLGACGGGAKPAEAPEAKAEDKPASAEKADDKSEASADKADAKPDAAKPDAAKPAAPADDGPKPTRTTLDILTAPDVVFLFDFNDSEPKQAAEEKCDKKAANNPKKKNECMAAERKNFPADGYRFKKDEKGQWWWITVRQNGNRLNALHKIPVEFSDETATSITLKPVGKDKGSAPMTPPAKIVFEVPNDYQIAFKDPKAGRLVFQAKVGVVTE
ncbi:MAG: hypothetical protein ABUL60_04245 [Myxococcales bacterium]